MNCHLLKCMYILHPVEIILWVLRYPWLQPFHCTPCKKTIQGYYISPLKTRISFTPHCRCSYPWWWYVFRCNGHRALSLCRRRYYYYPLCRIHTHTRSRVPTLKINSQWLLIKKRISSPKRSIWFQYSACAAVCVCVCLCGYIYVVVRWEFCSEGLSISLPAHSHPLTLSVSRAHNQIW